jgi:hypothetical protein
MIVMSSGVETSREITEGNAALFPDFARKDELQ